MFSDADVDEMHTIAKILIKCFDGGCLPTWKENKKKILIRCQVGDLHGFCLYFHVKVDFYHAITRVVGAPLEAHQL